MKIFKNVLIGCVVVSAMMLLFTACGEEVQTADPPVEITYSSHPSELVGVWFFSRDDVDLSEENSGKARGMVFNEWGEARQGTIAVYPGDIGMYANHTQYYGRWEVSDGDILSVEGGGSAVTGRYTIEGDVLTVTKLDGSSKTTLYRAKFLDAF